jgi:hypothetical protein
MTKTPVMNSRGLLNSWIHPSCTPSFIFWPAALWGSRAPGLPPRSACAPPTACRAKAAGRNVFIACVR